MHNTITQKYLDELTYEIIGSPKGILINFNCFNLFKEGQKTFVNEYFRKLPKE